MSDMPLVNQMFLTLRQELISQRESINAIRAKIETTSSAFAPRLYDTLAEANAAMTTDIGLYAKYAFAIISDVRDVGEGAGNGTGALCIWKPAPNVVSPAWYRLDNTVAVI